jgi:hypothetical protein
MLFNMEDDSQLLCYMCTKELGIWFGTKYKSSDFPIRIETPGVTYCSAICNFAVQENLDFLCVFLTYCSNVVSKSMIFEENSFSCCSVYHIYNGPFL